MGRKVKKSKDKLLNILKNLIIEFILFACDVMEADWRERLTGIKLVALVVGGVELPPVIGHLGGRELRDSSIWGASNLSKSQLINLS